MIYIHNFRKYVSLSFELKFEVTSNYLPIFFPQQFHLCRLALFCILWSVKLRSYRKKLIVWNNETILLHLWFLQTSDIPTFRPLLMTQDHYELLNNLTWSGRTITNNFRSRSDKNFLKNAYPVPIRIIVPNKSAPFNL